VPLSSPLWAGFQSVKPLDGLGDVTMPTFELPMRCATCSYDLSGLPPGADQQCKCPECGCEEHAVSVWPNPLSTYPVALPSLLLSAALGIAWTTGTYVHVVTFAWIGWLTISPLGAMAAKLCSGNRILTVMCYGIQCVMVNFCIFLFGFTLALLGRAFAGWV